MKKKSQRSKPGRPRKPKGKPRERFPRPDLLEAAEDALVRVTSDRKAARVLAQTKKLSSRHASRYVEMALERFKLDADTDPKRRADRRAVLQAQSEHVYMLCTTRGWKTTKKNGDVVERIEVDSRGAMAALAFQAAMHNLLVPDAAIEIEDDEERLLQLAHKHFGGGAYIDAPAEAVPALPPPPDAADDP
jgi:hypothetical protein